MNPVLEGVSSQSAVEEEGVLCLSLECEKDSSGSE
jgi:hypothetical protein